MTEREIIEQCKYYFGKDRTLKKDFVLAYDAEKHYGQWIKEIRQIISNAGQIIFNLNDDVILWIKDNEVEKIDWGWIGDLSWRMEIILNPKMDKSYDWDKKLALKCGGTVRILKVYFSVVVPCYTFNSYYMTYNKDGNYYEFGSISNYSKEEKQVINKVKKLLEGKKMQYIGKKLYEKQFKELYSDTNSEGNASLFDVLFSDIDYFKKDTIRFCDKDIIEKSGTKFRWTEYYDKNGILKERIESRWTSYGDYFKIVLDIKGQIKEIGVTRKEIEDKKYESFKIDIAKEFVKRKRFSKKKEKSREH